MTTERIVIVAGSRRGKSTLAAELSVASGAQVYCGDPASKAKENRPGVIYLPEGMPYSGDDGPAQWIADNWFEMPGPWIVEGHVTARALTRWLNMAERYGSADDHFPCDRIIVLDRPGFGVPLPGQNAQHKGVMTTWNRIASYFEPLVEYR
jgi:hypothetical protein